MWLFLIAVVAAIGFVLAAALLAPRGGNAPSPKKHPRILIADLVAGCRDLSRTACAAFEPKWRARGARTQLASDTAISDGRKPEFAVPGPGDAALLPRRMQFLGIDPEELARSEPLLFRRLAIRCRQCASRGRCERDLDCAAPDSIDEGWKDYCVNVALLRMLSAIEGIGESARGDGPVSAPGDKMPATGDIRH